MDSADLLRNPVQRYGCQLTSLVLYLRHEACPSEVLKDLRPAQRPTSLESGSGVCEAQVALHTLRAERGFRF